MMNVFIQIFKYSDNLQILFQSNNLAYEKLLPAGGY